MPSTCLFQQRMSPGSRVVVSRYLSVPDHERVQQNSQHALGGDTSGCMDNRNGEHLKLMMICCEENPPYGPAEDTANNFLELLCMSYERYYSSMVTSDVVTSTRNVTISITIYHAQKYDYPSTSQEWNSFNGVIIPGSLSAAYDDHLDWIHRLHTVIRDEIHENRRKTLGVCFGHQCFAHSFKAKKKDENNRLDCNEKNLMDVKDECKSPREHALLQSDGLAIKCPTGAKAGRIPCLLTAAGRYIFSQPFEPKESLQMLYTHGDMVHSLPSIGLSLGGNGDVPIEAAAYFESEKSALNFQHYVNELELGMDDTPTLKQALGICTNKHGSTSCPYAITFQAHPEYVPPKAFNVTFFNTVTAMWKRGGINDVLSRDACKDAKLNFDKVLKDSLDAMIAACITLGWFSTDF